MSPDLYRKISVATLYAGTMYGVVMISLMLYLPVEFCKAAHPTWTQADCESAKNPFKVGVIIWWGFWSHYVGQHFIICPFTIWHNSGGRLNLPLLKIATLGLVVNLIKEPLQIYQAMNAGELEGDVIPMSASVAAIA